MNIKVYFMDSDKCYHLFYCDGLEILDLGDSFYKIKFLVDDETYDFSLHDLFKPFDFLHDVAETGFADFRYYVLSEEIPF